MSAVRTESRQPRSDPGHSQDPEIYRIAAAKLAQLRAARPEHPDELHDKVYDRVVDALLSHPELVVDSRGQISEKGIRALVNRNFVWTIKSWQRDRLYVGGEPKPGPRTALSLDSTAVRTEGAAGMPLSGRVGTALDPERIVLGRERLSATLSAAHIQSPETAAVICDYIRGYGPSEISKRRGLAENNVSARKGRFVRKNRQRQHCD